LLLELTENLARLQSLNDLNQELLAQSLSYVQFSLNLFVGDDTSPTYTRPGANPAGRSIFDRKV
jgi:flagellar biosynthesis/type III secretory pathway chaperone